MTGDSQTDGLLAKLPNMGPGAPPAFMEKRGIIDSLLASVLSRFMTSARANDLRSSLSFHDPAVP